MNFLAAVNRVLRTNGIIKGDDDEVTTFSDTQHNATLNLAIIAIQDELNELISDKLINYELATASITTSSGVRTYALATDFIRFYEDAFFLDSTSNNQIFEYPGGKQILRLENLNYATQTGSATWWYWEEATTKKVGFYLVPNDDGRVLTYDYQKDVSVSASTDTLPFQNEAEAQTFCTMAARRHKALVEDSPNSQIFIDKDPTYTTSKARLLNLMRATNPTKNYGVDYR